MIELPGRDPTARQQFPGVPLRPRRVHQALQVGQASGDRHAPAQTTVFEGEEPGDVRAVVQDGDPGTRPHLADRDREVRAEEGISQRRGVVLKGPPLSDLRLAQLSRMDY